MDLHIAVLNWFAVIHMKITGDRFCCCSSFECVSARRIHNVLAECVMPHAKPYKSFYAKSEFILILKYWILWREKSPQHLKHTFCSFALEERLKLKTTKYDRVKCKRKWWMMSDERTNILFIRAIKRSAVAANGRKWNSLNRLCADNHFDKLKPRRQCEE